MRNLPSNTFEKYYGKFIYLNKQSHAQVQLQKSCIDLQKFAENAAQKRVTNDRNSLETTGHIDSNQVGVTAYVDQVRKAFEKVLDEKAKNTKKDNIDNQKQATQDLYNISQERQERNSNVIDAQAIDNAIKIMEENGITLSLQAERYLKNHQHFISPGAQDVYQKLYDDNVQKGFFRRMKEFFFGDNVPSPVVINRHISKAFVDSTAWNNINLNRIDFRLLERKQVQYFLESQNETIAFATYKKLAQSTPKMDDEMYEKYIKNIEQTCTREEADNIFVMLIKNLPKNSTFAAKTYIYLMNNRSSGENKEIDHALKQYQESIKSSADLQSTVTTAEQSNITGYRTHNDARPTARARQEQIPTTTIT